MITRDDDSAAITAPVEIPPEYGFRLDTVLLFGDPERPQEVEYIFVHTDDRGWTLRVLATTSQQVNALAFPPVVDRQPCSTRTIDIGGTEVFHAYRDPRYGQHEAVWKRGEVVFMLLAKPKPETSVGWFERFLKKAV